MRFLAFDVETANADLSSVCQIGMAYFEDGHCVAQWETFVNPEDDFAPTNVGVHGITADMVRGAPLFPEIAAEFHERLASSVIVTHTKFDLAAVRAVYSKHFLPIPDFRWIDSARVVRHVWQEFAVRGYGLSNVAGKLGIQFNHHNAVEDARAAGEILVLAISASGLTLDELTFDAFSCFDRPIRPASRRYRGHESVKREGNPEGDLFGEVLVFTGKLSMARGEAADIAAAAGCAVSQTVTKRTTLLVVGDQDVRLLGGKDKSNKHLQVEALIANGHPVRILCESDFEEIVSEAIGVRCGQQDVIEREISEPIRPKMPVSELFEGEDKGLISCWEQGRRFRESGSALSIQAGNGELPVLCWAGGISQSVTERRFGTLNYLAMWQGLRGEDLCINRSRATRITCRKFKTTVVFTADYLRRARKQIEADEASETPLEFVGVPIGILSDPVRVEDDSVHLGSAR